MIFDEAWHKTGCPYYDVYPSIIPMLTRLNLELAGEFIQAPRGIQHLLLRLPENQNHLVDGDVRVRVIFLSFQGCNREAGGVRERGLVVGIDVGERDGEFNLPIHTIHAFPLDERSVEEVLASLPRFPEFDRGIEVPMTLVVDCIRLALTICLLDDDPELINPDVLTKDRDKYECADEERRAQLVDKAKRRGKFAFSLGKGIEVIPHVRRPHPCLVWTGEGRRIPKVVKRRGSLIHRDQIERIPTGKDDSGDSL
jgi:hypothetical protein